MGYAFTNDWCVPHLDTWRTVLAPYAGRPNVTFAEIGSYEGRSACWFVDNILTGPGATMICIDPWTDHGERKGDDMEAVYRRFTGNVAACSRPWVIREIRAPSSCLLEFRPQQFDMVYVDGDHSAKAVLFDLVSAWRVLKVGGLMLCDDYNWEPSPPRPANDSPRTAIDAFGPVLAVGGHATGTRYGGLVVVKKEKE